MMVVAMVMALRLLICWTWRDLMFASCALLLASHNVYTFPMREPASSDNILFPNDHLTPYSEYWHGSRRTARDVSECQHTDWENRTYEEFKIPNFTPKPKEVQYKFYKYADTTMRGSKSKYLVGTIAYIEDPYYTFSVLEPNKKGGCEMSYSSATRSTVLETASRREYGCKLAANAGYFSMITGQCYGNIVSDGRIVQTTDDEQNANFGIREDGTIVVGYIPDKEILNGSVPFRQLVTGVIWLVRNGTNYVNESTKLECSSHEDTGKIDTFVNVLSARTAIGHDAEGRLVMAQIEGQTHRRGANLHEFAEVLINHGVVNAINLDGGGSNTLVKEGVLINYPTDHCHGMPEYRCPREVSTALCIHDVECIEPNCSGHGSCDLGLCSCDPPWIGEGCEKLNCSLTDCSSHGSCTAEGTCECDGGWMGEQCEKPCPHGRHGKKCELYCWCYGHSTCNQTTGKCGCQPGYKGFGCFEKCDDGFYGSGCTESCPYPDCSGHGHCSPINGSCLCDQGWLGRDCSVSLPELVTVLSSVTNGSQKLGGSGSGGLVPDYDADVNSTNTTLSDTVTSGDEEGENEDTPATPTATSKSTLSVDVSTGKGMCNGSVTQHGNLTQHGSVTHGDHTNDTTPNQALTAVLICILVAMITFMLHAALCFLTRKWAYRAALQRMYSTSGGQHPPPPSKKKRLRKRRPKFVQLPQNSSSSDCTF